ncbi:unnamed protein product, partial [Prorocentrum cordatum]
MRTSERCHGAFVCVMPLPLLRGSERARLNRDRLVRPAARPRARPGGCPSPSGPHTGTGRRQRGARCRAPGQHGQVVSQRLGVARDVRQPPAEEEEEEEEEEKEEEQQEDEEDNEEEEQQQEEQEEEEQEKKEQEEEEERKGANPFLPRGLPEGQGLRGR